MKSTYKSYKNLVERLTNRLDQAEEKYLDFEEKIMNRTYKICGTPLKDQEYVCVE
jgi:hypothetical protein